MFPKLLETIKTYCRKNNIFFRQDEWSITDTTVKYYVITNLIPKDCFRIQNTFYWSNSLEKFLADQGIIRNNIFVGRCILENSSNRGIKTGGIKRLWPKGFTYINGLLRIDPNFKQKDLYSLDIEPIQNLSKYDLTLKGLNSIWDKSDKKIKWYLNIEDYHNFIIKDRFIKWEHLEIVKSTNTNLSTIGVKFNTNGFVFDTGLIKINASLHNWKNIIDLFKFIRLIKNSPIPIEFILPYDHPFRIVQKSSISN